MLPAPLMVSEPGSFAEHTIVARKPQIIANLIAYNRYTPHIEARLRALGHEIAAGEVAPLSESAPDVPAWLAEWRPWHHHTWRALPWYFAEAYFYRRVLEATGYFQPGPWQGADPFAPQKDEALAQGLPALEEACGWARALNRPEEALRYWIDASLWGNRADLSNITIAQEAHGAPTPGDHMLLIDHRDALVAYVLRGLSRVDWVTDNSGPELLHDLALVDWLLASQHVGTIQVHAKRQPFFVSDAMPADILKTIGALSAQPGVLRELGERLAAAMAQGRLRLGTHPFWTSWQHYPTLPAELRATLEGSDLIVIKGDANYRRLIEDRHWPFTTPLEELVTYLPAPSVTLRTLKSELVVGLAEGVAERTAQADPNWLIDGRWGLVHLVMPSATP
jgi:hypothetical protein